MKFGCGSTCCTRTLKSHTRAMHVPGLHDGQPRDRRLEAARWLTNGLVLWGVFIFCSVVTVMTPQVACHSPQYVRSTSLLGDLSDDIGEPRSTTTMEHLLDFQRAIVYSKQDTGAAAAATADSGTQRVSSGATDQNEPLDSARHTALVLNSPIEETAGSSRQLLPGNDASNNGDDFLLYLPQHGDTDRDLVGEAHEDLVVAVSAASDQLPSTQVSSALRGATSFAAATRDDRDRHELTTDAPNIDPAASQQRDWIRARSSGLASHRDRDDHNKVAPLTGGGNTNQADSQSAPIRSRRFCIYYPAAINLWHCQGTQMTSVPADLSPKPISLLFSNVGLETLARSHLEPYRETLRDFTIENAPNLTSVETNVFANWTRLRVFYIIQAPRLVSLDFAIVGRHSDLTTIRVQQTGLRRWPDLSEFKQERILTSVDLDNNRIESLGVRPINIRAELVNLEFNLLTSIGEFTFNGSEIGALSLAGNRHLSFIHPQAFANLKSLAKLDLSGTSVAHLPTVGLHQLRSLIIRDNYALRQIPSIYVFPMLEEAHLTYAYHCCSFRYPKTHDPSAYEEHVRMQEQINAICNAKQSVPSRSATAEATPAPALERAHSNHPRQEHTSTTTTESSGFEGEFESVAAQPEVPASKQSSPPSAGSNSPPESHVEPPLAEQVAPTTNTTTKTTSGRIGSQWAATPPIGWNIECGELVLNASVQNITCTPEPDAFNPCEDIMGYPVLRVAVWLVVACSVMGNMSVIVVLLGIFRRLSVPKFLQLNLAIGDLVMGIYLAMLAAADLSTVGTYFNYAIDWQHGLGCRLAGASSLFASQLSIFTLIVITFERYYTITYTIDLNMRLQLGWAARIMFFGWLYAFAAAMLPVFGHINSYSKTSICLPMRTTYQLDRLFIIILLVIDSCAFLIIFICYLRMYLLILKQKTEATLKERTVAMRMALLVLTDFACWAPIIFFGATAVFGHPLISVTNSKILIVFFYPLNSMANPFLYVLSTRQYRRDLNYVLSRWRHWRKNLFKSQEDKDYSFNTQNPYNGANALQGNNKYLPAVYAHLGAVAAMTGVANHLHHYRVPLDCQNDAAGGGGQQVELIKLGGQLESNGLEAQRGDRNQCNHQLHYHHHRHHHHHNKRRSGAETAAATRGRSQCGCAAANGKNGGGGGGHPLATQYIIRHRILPERQNSTRAGAARLVQANTYSRKQSHQVPPAAILPAVISATPDEAEASSMPSVNKNKTNVVKLGHVIDDNNERVSSLADSKEDFNSSDVSKVVLMSCESQYQHQVIGDAKEAPETNDKSHLAVSTAVGGRRRASLNRRLRRCLCKSEQQLATTKLDSDSNGCCKSVRVELPRESNLKRSPLRFSKTNIRLERKPLKTGEPHTNSAPTTTTEPEPTTTTISEIDSTAATTTTTTTSNTSSSGTREGDNSERELQLSGNGCSCTSHERRHRNCHHHDHYHGHHRHRHRHGHNHRPSSAAKRHHQAPQSSGTSNLQVDQLNSDQQLSRSLDERNFKGHGDQTIGVKLCNREHMHRHHHRHHGHRHHRRHHPSSRSKCRENCDEHLLGAECRKPDGHDNLNRASNEHRHHHHHGHNKRSSAATREDTPSTQTIDLATTEDRALEAEGGELRDPEQI